MSVIEQLQRRTGSPDERARVLEMTDADADVVLDSLATDTRREVVRALFDEPAAASELAERLDMSIQNVHYHLDDLEEAGLVEPIDTVYSAKGNEMTVYGPANDPIVFVGDETRYTPVEQSLSSLVTGLGLLAVASLLVQTTSEQLVRSDSGLAADFGPSSTAPANPASPDMVVWVVFELLEPGLLFFTGCLAIAGLLAWRARP